MEKKIFKKLFSEISAIFILTSLTLGLIIWILQAVNFLDIISEDGHSISTYFKFSILNLPKIISKIVLLSFFLALFYILVSYDEKNQLLIYWSNGISKKRFINKLIIFSFIFIIFSFILSFKVVPFAQDKARSYIRSSSLDFFPSLIKPKQFIDTVENLTIFINQKKNQQIEHLILKDASNLDNVQFIIAKRGKIINEKNNKSLVLFDGKIISSSAENKSTIFNFKETKFNLDKYKTKTTTYPKIQELASINIYNCLAALQKKEMVNFKNFQCTAKSFKSLARELYKRTYLPLYIPLITIIVCFLVLNSHTSFDNKRFKLKIFLAGIFIVIFSQVSINLISDKMLNNILVLSVVPMTLVLSYILFISKMKSST
jgi:lipopolysaccharide export system permease protein